MSNNGLLGSVYKLMRMTVINIRSRRIRRREEDEEENTDG